MDLEFDFVLLACFEVPLFKNGDVLVRIQACIAVHSV